MEATPLQQPWIAQETGDEVAVRGVARKVRSWRETDGLDEGPQRCLGQTMFPKSPDTPGS